ncbi:hypothetical protein EBQ34_07035 [Vandammella animalimorsus]|uniref:Uncharacterized protein n=1 Tax=Vandammella animalimorsus TaxID=2029117 RepID=A0A3M6RJB2_9BURK|nr:hypothetical protein [Vandammella animalimorsus]RMX15430.1 hypothetical protein EBQ34_07035 [Vandammella animalimorsus]
MDGYDLKSSNNYQKPDSPPSSFTTDERANELRKEVKKIAHELASAPKFWGGLQPALSDSLASAVCEQIDGYLWERVVDGLRNNEDIYNWVCRELMRDLLEQGDIKNIAMNSAIARLYHSKEAEEAAIKKMMKNPELQRKVIDELKTLPELREQAVNEIKMNLAGIGSPLATSLDEAAILRAVDNMLDGRADDDDLDL